MLIAYYKEHKVSSLTSYHAINKAFQLGRKLKVQKGIEENLDNDIIILDKIIVFYNLKGKIIVKLILSKRNKIMYQNFIYVLYKMGQS